ncbi:qcrC domain protein [Mycobacterium xenopi 4042]|uniref:QcrC domain protein n=1 Tax=Mycobacterium xenopi 4042 TaxID=1299334 RepID=X7ZXC9_MYCXE|nr:qcrC domain protein [Mycobacterium xenopi 4042]
MAALALAAAGRGFDTKPQVAVADESSSALLRTGKQLFDTSCVTCHGPTCRACRSRAQLDRRR